YGTSACTHRSSRTPIIGLNACRSKVQPAGIGHPSQRHDRKRSLGTLPLAVLGEVHPHAGRRLLERLDGAEVLSHRLCLGRGSVHPRQPFQVPFAFGIARWASRQLAAYLFSIFRSFPRIGGVKSLGFENL